MTVSVRTAQTPHVLVIVIDRDHIRAGEGQQALAAAARFIGPLPSSDRVAVWTLPGQSGRLSFDERRNVVARKIRQRESASIARWADPPVPAFCRSTCSTAGSGPSTPFAACTTSSWHSSQSKARNTS